MKAAEEGRKLSSSSVRALSQLYGVTIQETVLFIVTAVRASNPESTVMCSYIMGSHFASMVGSVRISERPLPRPQNVGSTLLLNRRGGTRRTLKPETFCGTAIALLQADSDCHCLLRTYDLGGY
jgi:hypothetical protein